MATVSTKGRYALRVMLDLAEHEEGKLVPLTDIAARQQISEKYLEAIVAALGKAGLVAAVRGKGGGYRLNLPAQKCTVADVLAAAEGPLATVSCLAGEENSCPRANACRTLKVWQGLDTVMQNYLSGITLADLLTDNPADAYII